LMHVEVLLPSPPPAVSVLKPRQTGRGAVAHIFYFFSFPHFFPQ
jgi:hypothetical protein